MSNPCVRCGACCAHFRVQFYWREANTVESEHPVPPGMFEELTDMHRCMKGTARKHRPQCVGLRGRIGRDAHCGIYSNRPTPCRQFQASYANGRHQPRCDEARRAHGLPPLKPSDWISEPGRATERHIDHENPVDHSPHDSAECALPGDGVLDRSPQGARP